MWLVLNFLFVYREVETAYHVTNTAHTLNTFTIILGEMHKLYLHHVNEDEHKNKNNSYLQKMTDIQHFRNNYFLNRIHTYLTCKKEN